MLEAGNIGRAIGPIPVANRNFNNFKIEFMGAKYQVEISKRVKIPKKLAVFDQALIILFENYFGTAQGILKGLFKQPCKS